MPAHASNAGGRLLKAALVLAVLSIVVAASTVSSPPAHAIEPMQVTTLPDCSFKIDRTQTGVAIKELPDRLNNGSWLYVKCLVEQQPQIGWEGRTELIGADWKLNGTFAKTGDSIAAREYRGDGSIVIELEGYIPKNRVVVTANEEKDYLGQVDSYTREIAPPREILIVSLADDKTKDVKHKVNVWAIHPLTAEVESRILGLERNPTPYTESLVAKAEELNEEGRPWAALSLIDSVTPIFKSVEDSSVDLNATVMAHQQEVERIQAELSESEELQRWLMVLIGVAALVALLVGFLLGGFFGKSLWDLLSFQLTGDDAN